MAIDLGPDSVMALCERLQQRRGEGRFARIPWSAVTALPGVTCPACGRTSYHPDDVREGYCGNCHGWTSVPAHSAEALRERLLARPTAPAPEVCTTCHHAAQQHSFAMQGGVLVTRCPACLGGICG